MGTNLGKTLLVLQPPLGMDRLPAALDGYRSDHTRVLSFLSDGSETEKFLSLIRQAGFAKSEVILLADLYDNALRQTRDRYVDFMGKWPETFRRNGKNFKELFIHNRTISLWWFTAFSMKSSETSPIIGILMRLKMVEELLAGDKFDRCILLGGDTVFARLLEELSYSKGCTCVCLGPKPQRFSFRNTVLWHVKSRIKCFVDIACTKLVLAMFHEQARRLEGQDKRGLVLFSSIYAEGLTLSDGALTDRFYRELPDFINKEGRGLRAAYSNYLYGRFFSSLKLFFGLMKDPKLTGRQGVVFLERYLSWRDLVRHVFDCSIPLRYLVLEAARPFRNSFRYRGMNIFPVVKDELRASFVSACIPRCILTAIGYERFARRNEPLFVFSFLELYNVSKAVYYGVRQSGAATKTIAYQHALIAPMTINYRYNYREIEPAGSQAYVSSMPLPDYFIFQGDAARREVVEWGFPKDRTFLTGSPRYDALSEASARLKRSGRAGSAFPDKKTILVATTYTKKDSDKLARIVAAACDGRKDNALIFKSHPNYDISDSLRALKGRYLLNDCSVQEKPLYELIAQADVLVTTYSTVAAEAIVLGCPVICLAEETEVDQSIFFSIDKDVAIKIRDSRELSKALDVALYDRHRLEGYKKNWERFIESNFFRIDGKAKDRIFHLLNELAGKKANV